MFEESGAKLVDALVMQIEIVACPNGLCKILDLHQAFLVNIDFMHSRPGRTVETARMRFNVVAGASFNVRHQQTITAYRIESIQAPICRPFSYGILYYYW